MYTILYYTRDQLQCGLNAPLFTQQLYLDCLTSPLCGDSCRVYMWVWYCTSVVWFSCCLASFVRMRGTVTCERIWALSRRCSMERKGEHQNDL